MYCIINKETKKVVNIGLTNSFYSNSEYLTCVNDLRLTNMTDDNSILLKWNDNDSKTFQLIQGNNNKEFYAKYDSDNKLIGFDVKDIPIDLSVLKANKIQEIKDKCHDIIVAGIDSNYKDGTNKHYSLTEDKQRTMDSLANLVGQGAKIVPFRDDSIVICEPYNADVYMKIYKQGSKFILESRYYSDGLEKMVESAKTKEELDAIQWGITLPQETQDYINTTINEMGIWGSGN